MPETRYVFRPAQTDADLRGILDLQAANHRDRVPPESRAANGFVSLRHTLELLREMNHPWAHAVATTGEVDGAGRVVGYALMMPVAFRDRLPTLDPMFDRLDALARPGGPLAGQRFYVMGQVCVDGDHRGRGLVEGLYADLARRTRADFDLMVTEISVNNPRSLAAHRRAGFAVLDEYVDDRGERWIVVALDLHNADGRSSPA